MMHSVRTKLLVMILALVAVPLIISVAISYNSATNKAMADAQESLEWQAWYLQSEFAGIIKENLVAIQAIASADSTVAYLEGQHVTDEQMMESLLEIDAIFNDGNALAITDSTGQQLLRTVGNPVNVAEREYFLEAMAGNTYVSDIIISKSTGARQITMSTPVYGSEGTVIGIIQRNYDLNTFHEFLASESDDAFIVSREGLVAAHSQHEIVGGDEEEDRSGAEFFTSGLDEGFYTSDTGKGYKAMMAYVKDPTTGFIVVAASNTETELASARASAAKTVIIGIVLLIVSGVITVFVTNSMTSPIKEVNTSLGDLADGRFTNISKYADRKDEFGDIIRSTNSVIDRLTVIVGNIKSSAGAVGDSSGELSEMANQISQTADDVSTAVQEIATGATQQADEIQTASENVAKIGDAVSDVKAQATELENLAGSMKGASEVSSKSLEELKVSSDNMNAKIEEIENTINATQKAVASMSEKVEGISSVAAQTNLLSLNASIEAARAGEAGRGFAVVAEEIGKLADSSKLMAEEIKTEMDVLLHQAKAAVTAADEVKEGNANQKIALDNTLESIGGMLDDIEATVRNINVITEGAERCVEANSVVSDSMTSLSAISEENAASSEETGASMEELSATVTILANSASDLKNISEKLTEDMKFFKD